MFDFKGYINKHGMNFLDDDIDGPCPFDITTYIECLFGKVNDDEIRYNHLNEKGEDTFNFMCDYSDVKIQMIGNDDSLSLKDFTEIDELNDYDDSVKSIIITGNYENKKLISIFNFKGNKFNFKMIINDEKNNNYGLVFGDDKECKFYDQDSVMEYYTLSSIHPVGISDDNFISYDIKPDLSVAKKNKDIGACYASFIKKVL